MLSFYWRLFPFFVVVIGFILANANMFAAVEAEMLRNMPYFLSAVLLVFASMFNRSRFISPILIALIVYVFIRERLQAPLSDPSILTLFTGLNALFCIQLLIVGLLPEKGMFNRSGIFLSFCLLGASAGLWFVDDAGQVYALIQGFITRDFVNLEQHYWVTDWVVAIHLATVAILVLVAFIRRGVAEYALLLTWLAGAFVFYDFAVSDVSSVSFSGLFIALFIVFQQSNYQVTYMDALTGIPGRRSLDDYLTTLGKKYAIAMLDVDHFKKFNDTYGHDVGDQVLKMVASKINQVEGGGKAFRYGGEEFTIVFNRRDAAHSFVFLEAVRESVQNYEMTLRSEDREEDKKEGKKKRGSNSSGARKVSVTISIGIADSMPGYTPQDVIKSADELLYKAKEAGRNCTIKPQ